MKGACFPDFRSGGGAGGVLKPRHVSAQTRFIQVWASRVLEALGAYRV